MRRVSRGRWGDLPSSVVVPLEAAMVVDELSMRSTLCVYRLSLKSETVRANELTRIASGLKGLGDEGEVEDRNRMRLKRYGIDPLRSSEELCSSSTSSIGIPNRNSTQLGMKLSGVEVPL